MSPAVVRSAHRRQGVGGRAGFLFLLQRDVVVVLATAAGRSRAACSASSSACCSPPAFVVGLVSVGFVSVAALP